MVGFSTTAIFNIQTVPYAFSDSVVFALLCNIMHLSVINTFVVRPSTALQAMHAACSSGCCKGAKNTVLHIAGAPAIQQQQQQLLLLLGDVPRPRKSEAEVEAEARDVA